MPEVLGKLHGGDCELWKGVYGMLLCRNVHVHFQRELPTWDELYVPRYAYVTCLGSVQQDIPGCDT